MAAGGYKQPQQFLALAYLLAQGAHFDLVINVDGFNEIALPPAENRPHGVAPLYPRGWFWRVGNLKDARLPEAARCNCRRRCMRAPIGHGDSRSGISTTAVCWRSRGRAVTNCSAPDGIGSSPRSTSRRSSRRQSYAATGPAMTFADDPSYYAYLARVWRDSSLQMRLLCDANGIAYAHFLQPNQHVEGSKSMTPEERKLMLATGDVPGFRRPRLSPLAAARSGAAHASASGFTISPWSSRTFGSRSTATAAAI